MKIPEDFLVNIIGKISQSNENSNATVIQQNADEIAIAIKQLATLPDNELRALMERQIRQSFHRLNHVSIVTTGNDWLGGGTMPVLSEAQALVKNAETDITFVCYRLTGGADEILTSVENAVRSGVKFTTLLNRFDHQVYPNMKERLFKLSREYPNTVKLFNFDSERTEIHAKLLLVDKKKALIGSANFTVRGMVTNYEIAASIEGPAAQLISDRVDFLLRSSHVQKISPYGSARSND